MYDYAAGKMDWFAAGLPREGSAASTTRIADRARAEVLTAAPDDDVDTVTGRLVDGEILVVVNGERVVLGVVTAESLEEGNGRSVDRFMQEAPTTYRPHTAADEVAEWMRADDAHTHVLVTDPGGHLLGVAHRRDVEGSGSGS
ncbi:MAG TPA: CBS domain-containing protein [Acidimicrobiia bacterium]|nr:CBS domain-containing protein [Acidimicrobiia bacterium]